GADDGAFNRAGDDLLRSMIPGGVLDNPVAQQRPILHQTTHPNVPPDRYSALSPQSSGEWHAEKSSRKLDIGTLDRRVAAMVTAAALVLWTAAPANAREARLPGPLELFAAKPKPRGARHVIIPMPQPRPAEAPQAETRDEPAKEAAEKPSDEPLKKAEPPPPSACRLALTEEIAIAPSVPDIKGPGGCGGEDLVRLEAIMLPDKRKVAVKPAAILRCKMASAIADWIRTDIVPIAAKLGSQLSDLDNFDSFECRGRNRVPGAQLSEHGRANALDVRAFKL
ncbi:hypothetical protein KXV85_000373, partial [Aspergillus fumigatus]